MALIISSSQNSPDVLKQDKVETSLKGKVNQEHGGTIPQEVVIIDSGGPKPDSLFNTCTSLNTSKEMAHQKEHQLQSDWETKPI